MFDYARAGDTVVVTAIDRLGRSVAEVTRTIADLGECRICCAPYAKESIPPHRLGVLWPRSWPHSPSSNLTRPRAPCRIARIPPCSASAGHEAAKLSQDRQEQLRRLAATGEPVGELAKGFGIGRGNAYRYLSRPTNAVPGPTRKESGCKS